ncbi:hypothetical protein N7462_001256 [Penicillium macrosclerotiorum]|uniref:uncharacterized protein n=1 Tax=Penicillium macrosclerotiorum TaxID=303699 RepID=UPI0025484C2A|nr:uncharacterized protein N7462_001256 [Penicillium macrosclerotiorum]KAJ5691833.1 hypothetical protein N7462_001256 [Penicillium macrosclerotiorum]
MLGSGESFLRSIKESSLQTDSAGIDRGRDPGNWRRSPGHHLTCKDTLNKRTIGIVLILGITQRQTQNRPAQRMTGLRQPMREILDRPCGPAGPQLWKMRPDRLPTQSGFCDSRESLHIIDPFTMTLVPSAQISTRTDSSGPWSKPANTQTWRANPCLMETGDLSQFQDW